MKNPITKIMRLFFGIVTALFVGVAVAPFVGASAMAVAAVLLAVHLIVPMQSQGMAFDLTISDTTYAGTFASYFWIPATFAMDTIQKGVIYVQDGIKKKHTIGRIDFSNPLQPREATPTSQGTFTVSGRVLEPADIMVYSEFNPRDYEQHWLAEQLSPTLLARELPVTAENYMLQIALKRALEQLETGIWQGSTDYSSLTVSDERYQLQFFDGFIKKMVNDSAVLAVATPVTLTSSNILSKMDDCISKMATSKKALLASPKRYDRLKFLVSVNTEQLYLTALTTGLTFKGNTTNERGTKPYKGYEVVALAGMPDDTIVFCEAIMDVTSNLYVGMNSTEDNQLQLQRLQNNSELFFVKGLMKYDVQYGFSDQVVLYTTLVAADFQP